MFFVNDMFSYINPQPRIPVTGFFLTMTLRVFLLALVAVAAAGKYHILSVYYLILILLIIPFKTENTI